tara:strand:+ start:1454 stop:1876 length:423 start_codon:yes stop_codon:yes gene_type:complete
MKQQEIFNKAAVHLMGMEGPSVDYRGEDGGVCVYRGEDDGGCYNGQMCAVGVFIADEHYFFDLEGQGISGGQDVVNAVAASWGQDDLTVAQISLLADLQDAHDETPRDKINGGWSKNIVASLDGVATKHHLRFDPNGASA